MEKIPFPTFSLYYEEEEEEDLSGAMFSSFFDKKTIRFALARVTHRASSSINRQPIYWPSS